MSKKHICDVCGRALRTHQGLRDHQRDKHCMIEDVPKSVRAELAAEIFGDLSDGALFAAARDVFGVKPDDFITWHTDRRREK